MLYIYIYIYIFFFFFMFYIFYIYKEFIKFCKDILKMSFLTQTLTKSNQISQYLIPVSSRTHSSLNKFFLNKVYIIF